MPTDIPKDILEELVDSKSHKRKIALRVTAYLYNKKPDAFQKVLAKARRQYPGWRKFDKVGIELVSVK